MKVTISINDKTTMNLIAAKLRNKLHKISNPVMTTADFWYTKHRNTFIFKKLSKPENCSTKGIQSLHLGYQTHSFQKDPCDIPRGTLIPQ